MNHRSLFWMSLAYWLMFLIPNSLPGASLAITEVMSSASTNLGPAGVESRADYWELTNFGTNTVDLTEYRFSDSAGIDGAEREIFRDRQIGPGESILFFQVAANVFTNAAQFRAWWGLGNLPADRQIYGYRGYGFSSVSDAVQLWKVTATETNLVDRVELPAARRGFSFTYDTATGFLDSFSVAGESGAFKAAETDDVGSPGFTAGAVPLRIIQQPQGLTVDGGTPAMFRVQAVGLPKPRYQWHFKGEPIPGAISSILEIPAVTPTQAGAYSVELDNGLSSRLSAPAVLQVNTTLTPPSVSRPPVDLIVSPGQTAVFEVLVRGFELPTFQWRFEETDLPDATNRTLTLVHTDLASSGTYSVRIQNSLGSTNASAQLTVRPKPNLMVTEIMGSRSINTTLLGRSDWWELTNFDSYPVNLRGYQFDDGPGLVAGAVVITNEVMIQPGESILFIQDMTPEFFIRWWGEENLPENVQFVRYSGNGFSALGDSVTLWNATPLDRSDFIHQVEYAQDLNPDFTPIGGPSRIFWCERFEEFGWPSVVGQCGAVRASASEDVGSPGYIAPHPPRTIAPRSLGVSQDEQGIHHTWQTQTGKRYELQRRDDLGGADWRPLSQETATGVSLTTHDPITTGVAQRFYRLVVVSNSP